MRRCCAVPRIFRRFSARAKESAELVVGAQSLRANCVAAPRLERRSDSDIRPSIAVEMRCLSSTFPGQHQYCTRRMRCVTDSRGPLASFYAVSPLLVHSPPMKRAPPPATAVRMQSVVEQPAAEASRAAQLSAARARGLRAKRAAAAALEEREAPAKQGLAVARRAMVGLWACPAVAARALVAVEARAGARGLSRSL